MRVTIKGQITIPLALRERFNLQPGTEVEFIAGRHSLEIRPRDLAGASGKAFDLWLAKAAGSARSEVSTDQHMALTRGRD